MRVAPPVNVFVPESASVPAPDFVSASDEAPPLRMVPLIVVLPSPPTVSVWAPALPPVPPCTAPLKSSVLVVLLFVKVHVPAAPVPSSTLALNVSFAATLALIVIVPMLGSSVRFWLPTAPLPIV